MNSSLLLCTVKPSRLGFTLKGKNLLLLEQILSCQSEFLSRRKAKMKMTESFPVELYTWTIFFRLFFPSKTIPKNLDPSYKIDLDLLACLGRVNLMLKQTFIGLT